MNRLNTLTGNPFQYKRHPDGEIIIYIPDREGHVQNKSAIVVTPFTINLVKRAIELAHQEPERRYLENQLSEIIK